MTKLNGEIKKLEDEVSKQKTEYADLKKKTNQ
jgi:cell division protein FtsL